MRKKNHRRQGVVPNNISCKRVDCWDVSHPSQDSSHEKDDITFLVSDPYKPSLAACIMCWATRIPCWLPTAVFLRECDVCIIHYDALVTLGICGGLPEGYGKQYYCSSFLIQFSISFSHILYLAYVASKTHVIACAGQSCERSSILACCYIDIIRSARLQEFDDSLHFYSISIPAFMAKCAESRLS